MAIFSSVSFNTNIHSIPVNCSVFEYLNNSHRLTSDFYLLSSAKDSFIEKQSTSSLHQIIFLVVSSFHSILMLFTLQGLLLPRIAKPNTSYNDQIQLLYLLFALIVLQQHRCNSFSDLFCCLIWWKTSCIVDFIFRDWLQSIPGLSLVAKSTTSMM